jgi:hypothetical protein
MLRQSYVSHIEMMKSTKEVVPEPEQKVGSAIQLDTRASVEVGKEVVPEEKVESVAEPPCDDTRAKVELEAEKPMSAQAKRRAAHRRRMELDFGGKAQ